MSIEIDDINVFGDEMPSLDASLDITMGEEENQIELQEEEVEEEEKENINSYTAKNTKLIGFGNKSFSPHDVERINKLLQQPVVFKHLKQRKMTDNDFVKYLSGDESVHKANELFGVNGWSFQILKMINDINEETDNSTKIAYTVLGRITLKDGTMRENVGANVYSYYGNDYSKLHDKLRTHSNAKKSAITDCIKRTLSLFGQALGLGLSSSNYQKAMESNTLVEYKNVNININNNNQPLQLQQQQQQQPIILDSQIYYSPGSSPNATSSPTDNSVVPGAVKNSSPNKSPSTNQIPNLRYNPYSKPTTDTSNLISPPKSINLKLNKPVVH